jgi:hypothetical protein
MRKTLALLCLVGSPACGANDMNTSDPGGAYVGDVGDDQALSGLDEQDALAFAGTLAAGNSAHVCNTGTSGLRQRTGPGTGYTILRVMPEGSTVKILAGSGGWYKNDWGGRVGWSSGQYLCKVTSGGSTGGASLSAPATPSGTIQIAKATVGFSYWWGGGRFASGASHGACYGSCPNCSHSGSYGADCSGLIGKVWRLPEAMPMDANKHPFSTVSFQNYSTHWRHLSRSSTKMSDALVYNSGGAGHIFLFEKGDPWGSMWTYEARGCSYGVVHNLRTAGSAYHMIRRFGY